MAPHSSTLAWKIPWTEEPGEPRSPWGHKESDTTEWLHFHFSLSRLGEGNGNPLQCSCLENPRDRGAWWAAVYGVAQSRTQLKRLSSSGSRLGFSICSETDFMHRTCHMQIYNVFILLFLHHWFLSSSVSVLYLCPLSFWGPLSLSPLFQVANISLCFLWISLYISKLISVFEKKKFPLLACNITFLIWVFPFPGALPDQGLNPGLLHCKWILSHLGET